MKISKPVAVTHNLHVDRDMKWTFDPSVKPEDNFQIIREIGRGGFGAVYEMLHTQSGYRLAGKVVNEESMSSSAKQSLLKEIDLLKKINSPYTVQYFGNIIFNKQQMILMEYCDRGSFRDMIDYRNLCLTEKQAAIVIKDVLSGILILHTKHKVLHRDIKAANILLMSDGGIRLTDFGISRDFSGGTLNTMSSIGTPYWMAPEVINSQPYSYPADIWSIGATTIELVEGAPPYCELEPTKAMMNIAAHGFPGFRAPRAVTKEFKDFIAHTMSKDPKNRCTIPQLLKHPWIQQVDTLNRVEVMKPLTSTIIDLKALKEMIGAPSTDEGTRIITTARNTLRRY
ncbi:STE family protein kinase [Trichomonas vaginalis G3]|uniref:non-specific serine/threonine protein kinase n=1 Tax=Trichomonas vaginalis (strain ATCC PRA-98 / G3) TaxID=412133 RepID=A2G0I5_TRIV3|nr:hippo signaling [Trichomonas vaginalis G3]XP_051106222.1 hippo signaling [Trichomonas vaginalis G3]EAX89323.1 STE family protein kinase [Trichomonas vaginalis G3]KAI5541571.1 hippo signaling [Trichomonas vaginalis G3]KAI5541690.1 hippo signaling [Trichomonas vaginalis G3]|eukprot:XP_001302253.1 STE family protein kinase [Trichomonas vaginalis G3]